MPNPAFVRIALILMAGSVPVRAQDTTHAPARLALLPVIGSAPETGLQYGATALRVYRRGPAAYTNASQLQVYAINTANGQQRAFLQLDQWSAGNDTRLRASASFEHFPLPFYPVGSDSPDSAEARYTSTGPELSASMLWNRGRYTYVGVGARIRRATISNVDLTDWRLADAPTLEGNTTATAQILAVNDTRDHALAPHGGVLHQLTLASSFVTEGGLQRNFSRITIDHRRYHEVATGVVAFRLGLDWTPGYSKAPFDQMPMVGADGVLRGYTRGRYRDKQLLAAEGEYRSGYWRRVGMAAFGGWGTTRHTLFSGGTSLPSLGAGLRYQLLPAERMVVRVDYARGKGTSGLYIALGEAF